MTRQDFLPYGKQYIDQDDIDAVTEVLKSDWLTTGPAVERFEQKLAQVTGARQAVSCSSGTAALHLALLALDIGPGDSVIVSAMSFAATANAVLYVGADVIFADVDENNGLTKARHIQEVCDRLRPEQLRRIKAVIVVNLAGQITEIEGISEIARQHNWKFIVDSCHAIGTSFTDSHAKPHMVGDCAFCDMEVFSFHPVKTIAAGEGGAVTTNCPELSRRLRLFRNHGMVGHQEQWENQAWAQDRKTPPPWYYEIQALGYNYRLSDIHAALGLSQLSKLADFKVKRQQLADHYDQALMALSPLIKPISRTAHCQAAWHLYVILIDFGKTGKNRTDIMKSLAADNIGTQVHYIPIPRHPIYQRKNPETSCPGADAYYARTLSLPLHYAMDFEDVDDVVDKLKHKVLKNP